MKTKDLVFGLVTAASILAADARADLFGKYQVIKNQCSTNLSIGSDVQIRTGDDGDFELGRFEKDLDQTFFKAAFAYTVGISKRPCLGDCYDLFEPRRPLEIPPSVAGSKSPRRQGVNLNRVTLSPALQQA